MIAHADPRGSGQGGFAAAEWVVGLGLFLLPMAMIVGSIAPWLARQTTGRLIAQEAARHVVLASAWSDGVEAAGRIASTIAANNDLDQEDWELTSIRSEPPGSSLLRGIDVVVEVRIRLPALTVPGFGSVAEVWWSTQHVEHVDDFRSFP